MKKILLFALLLLVAVSRPLLAQTHTQSFTFDDLGLGGGTPTSGTYNQNDTFSFNVYLTFAGYGCYAYDLWLETQTLNNFAVSLAITGVTYGKAFPDVIQTQPNPAPFNVSSGASPGYLTEARSLGALAAGGGPSFLPNPPGTYLVATISLAITGAQPGTYTLQSTTVSPHQSIATSRNGAGSFMDNPIPVETYTITIVPEPSIFALLTVAVIGLLATCCHRRHFAQAPERENT